MNLYVLSAEQRAAIEEWNRSKDTELLIVCDYGDGDIGVDAERLKNGSNFAPCLDLLGCEFDCGVVKTITITDESVKIVG